MSLVKYCVNLGFPFYKITPQFNEKDNSFDLPKEVLSMPHFPIEGMFTRNINLSRGAGLSAKFIETSSPGLPGQSGGPIFDSDGKIWAIQSSTTYYNFNRQDGKRKIRATFDCGIGAHPEAIIVFMKNQEIKFRMSDK